MVDSPRFKTILLASDGSKFADHALEVAAGIASLAQSRVFILHVTQVVGGKGGAYPVQYDEEEIRSKLEDQASELKVRGIEAAVRFDSMRLGSPAHDISETADSVAADLIVVGSRGHSPLSQVLLGSVPVRLLQIAGRPVLVVPLPKGE